jgi:hypothetical protein
MRKSMVNRRIAGVGGSEFSAMGWGRILTVMVVSFAGGAAAQTPWPTQQQPQQQQQAPWPAQQQSKPQGQAAWPAQQPQQSQGQSAWPQQHQAAAPGAPMTPMGAPGMSPGPGMMSPMGPPGGQQVPPCAAVLNKLHPRRKSAGRKRKPPRHGTPRAKNSANS